MQVIVDGIATEYRDEGNGPVILFLHGWQDNLHTLDAVVSMLSKSWRVIRFDLPGFGNTEMPPFAWYLDDYTQFVAKFVQKLGITVDCIVGHSFGGRVIIKGLVAENVQAKRVVLIASAGVAERRKARSMVIKIFTKLGAAITWIPPFIFWREKMRSSLYSHLGSDYAYAGNMKEVYLNVVKEDLSSVAAKIKNPILLIWGDHDTATPITEGRRLAELITGSILKVVQGAGHFVHQEQSEKVAEYINDFLHD